jgi:sulfur-oxidizing protein SoxY
MTSRRQALAGLAGGAMFYVLGEPASAAINSPDVTGAIRKVFGDGLLTTKRVTLDVPAMTANGNLVPVSVQVDSPMTEADYVSRIALFGNANPSAHILTAIFSPRSGRAMFSTKVRLVGSQKVIAVAEMNDSSLWRAEASVEVTVGACLAPCVRF